MISLMLTLISQTTGNEECEVNSATLDFISEK